MATIFQIPSLQIQSIIVYSDCALVKRHLKLELAQGLNECTLEGLSNLVDEKLINIDGIGNGAKIESIQFLTEKGEIGKNNENKEEEENGEEEILNAKATKVRAKIEFNTKLCDNLVQIVEGKNFVAEGDEKKKTGIFEEEIRSLETKYTYCEQKLTQLLEKRFGMELELKTLETKIRNCKIGGQKQNKIVEVDKKRKIHILLSAQQKGEVEIGIGYQIERANWSPHYEFCIIQGNGGKDKVEVNCFGNVNQNTGEDWKDAKLILSTGTSMGQAANFGVEMPKVDMIKAEIISQNPSAQILPFGLQRQRPINSAHLFGATCSTHNQPTAMGQTRGGGALFGAANNAQQSTTNDENDEWENFDECLQRPVAIAQEFTIGTNFMVKNATTILSSKNSQTKLNIASMEMDCQLLYECIPSKIVNVFLKAKMVNSVDHPLPAGTYSIRMDGNLSSTKNLKLETIGSGETFLLPICIYTGVKVGYQIEHKYSEKKHPLFENGSPSSLIAYLHSIELKNLKSEQILLTVYQPIPKPNNDEIKIKLISPEIDQIMPMESKNEEMPKSGIWMDAEKHILKWTLELKGKEEKKFRIQYELECPNGKRIRIAQN